MTSDAIPAFCNSKGSVIRRRRQEVDRLTGRAGWLTLLYPNGLRGLNVFGAGRLEFALAPVTSFRVCFASRA